MKRIHSDSESTVALLERLQRERPDLARRLRAALDNMEGLKAAKRPRSSDAELVYEEPLNVASFVGPGIEPPVSILPPMLAITGTGLNSDADSVPVVIPSQGVMLTLAEQGERMNCSRWMNDEFRDDTVAMIRVSDFFARYVVTKSEGYPNISTREIIPMQSLVVFSIPFHTTVRLCSLLMLETDADLIPFKRDYTS